MTIIHRLPGFFTRLFHRRPTEAKRVWGRHSPIDSLADSLAKQPQGWVLEPTAIHRNGILISWHGSLQDSRTAVKVTMDQRRFRITGTENKVLKHHIMTLQHQAGSQPG